MPFVQYWGEALLEGLKSSRRLTIVLLGESYDELVHSICNTIGTSIYSLMTRIMEMVSSVTLTFAREVEDRPVLCLAIYAGGSYEVSAISSPKPLLFFLHCNQPHFKLLACCDVAVPLKDFLRWITCRLQRLV